MIEIVSDNKKVRCKIAGNLNQLLSDTRNICNSLACTLVECAGPEAELAVVCCIQSMFADCVTSALYQIFNNSENANKHEGEVSSIKIDMEALRDFLENKDKYDNDESEEDNT